MRKSFSLASLIIFCISLLANPSQAQIGKLKDKATNLGKKDKDKAKTEETKTTTDKGSSTNTTNTTKSNTTASVVSTPTVEFSTDYLFKNKKADFEPGDEIFIRLLTPKPMGEMFKNAFKMDDIPMSGSMAIAIGKDANDENPIVVSQYSFFPSRYDKDNQFAVTLQLDEAKLEKLGNDLDGKVPFNSVQTMSQGTIKLLWAQQAGRFTVKKYQWTIFFFYKKANSDDIAEAGSGVFTYNVTTENKKKLIEGMNFYDKASFEKTPDDGIKTDVHKANVGKIVFTNTKITPDFNDAGKLKNDFPSLSGGIYARLYLSQSVKNFLAEDGKAKDYAGSGIGVFLTVNGKEYIIDDNISKEDGSVKTNWAIDIAPTDKAMYEEDPLLRRLVYQISILPPGKHKVKIDVRVHFLSSGKTSWDEAIKLAQGEFQVNVTQADRDAYAKKFGRKFEGNTLPQADFVNVVKKQYPALGYRFSVLENKLDGAMSYRVSRLRRAYKSTDGNYYEEWSDIRQDFIGGKWAPSVRTIKMLGNELLPPQNIKP